MDADFFNLRYMTRIALIATGGTIACTTTADGSLVPTVSGATLAADIDAEVVEFRQLDSSSITLADLDELIAVVNAQTSREDIDGVIITHGTDSPRRTALATCAMPAILQPAGAPGCLSALAVRAFRRAVRASGTLVTCAGLNP